jgi:hypothetical protein
MSKLKSFRTFAVAAIAALFLAQTVDAQGDLSSQVLRLLTRENYWSAIQTYAHTVGINLEAGTAPSVTTDTLYNIGGNLYWNGALVTTASGVGTVTSVAMTVPAIFSVAGSPITSSGTLAVSLATQSANRIFAGPSTGSAATPTFRAIVDDDVPDTITINGSGNVTWASVSKSGSSLADLATRSASDLTSGTLPNAQFPATLPAASGVNLTALNASNLASGTVAAARMPALTGDVTTSAGTVATALSTTGVTAGSYTMASITVDAKGRLTAASTGSFATSGLTGTVAVANGGTNISVYAIGDILYASTTGVLSRLADITTGSVLISGGFNVAPSWGKVGLTTHVSGTLPVANGGTNLTAATDDTTPIGNGTTWQAKTLPAGVLSYDTATNTFSVPTTFILGNSAPTPSVNNILLRSNTNALLEVTLGNQSALGNIRVGKAAIGANADYGFTSSYISISDLYAGGDITFAEYTNIFFDMTPTAAVTHNLAIFAAQTILRGTQNFTADVNGVYGGVYPETSGTVNRIMAVGADSEYGGSGTITTMASLLTFTGNYGSGTVTSEMSLYVTSPYNSGGGIVTNNYGLYIEDQTLAGTTINDAIRYDAPTSHTFLLTSAGLMGVYGGVPSATAAVFKVGGTMASTTVDNGNSGTTKTIDLSTGNQQMVTLTGNVTFTLSNPADSGVYHLLIKSGAGGFTATWPATVKWSGGTAPTITATAARADLITLVYNSSTSDYYGSFVQNFTP